MKKNTKSATSSRKARHSKSAAKKPVTIDLTAEKVVNQGSATDPTTKSKTVETKKTEPKTKSAASGFGRNPKTETKSKRESVAATSKETKSTLKKSSDSPKEANPSRPNSGLVGKFAAGVVGGVVALGGAGALQMGGYLPSVNSDRGDYASSTALTETRSDLLSKVEALQNRLKEAESTPAIDQAFIDAAVDKRIQQMQANNPSPAPEVGKADIDGLDGKIAATSKTVATFQQQLAKAEAEVEQLKQSLSNGQAGEEAGLATLGSRLDGVDTTLSDMGTKLAAVEQKATKPSAPDAKTSAAIAALQAALPKLQSGFSEKFSAVDQKITSSKKEIQSLLTPVQKQVQSLAGKYEDLTQTTQQLSNTTKQVDDKLANLQSTVDASIATEKKAARAIAAAAVKSAIDRGEPFNETLATLKNVAGKSEDLDALTAFAETGVPTQTKLTAQFAVVGENIVTALTPKPDGSLADRLLAGAQSLVKIKSIGEETAATPRDKVGAIANQLSNGDLSATSALWSKLPEAGQAVSKEWHNGLQARIKANQLVDQTVQTYLLSGSGQ